MENNNKPRGFFRRPSDADSESRNERLDRSDDTPSYDRSSREDHPSYGDRRPSFGERRPSSDRPGGDRPGGDRPWQKREGNSNDRPWHKREGGNSDRPWNRPERSDRPRYGTDSRSDRGDRNDRGDRAGSREERPEREAPENVIFGIHPVREAIEAGTQIEKIYFRREGFAHVDEEARRRERWDRGDHRRETPRDNTPVNTAALDALRLEAADAGIHIQEVPIEKLNRLTRNGNHQGVVAVTAAIEYKEINELIENIEKGIEAYNRSQEELAAQEAVSDDQVIVEQITAATAPLIVVMDSVTDIRNFGAIARSAECAGAMALVMPLKNSAPVNAEAIKSSAGALNLIPVSRVGSLKGAVARLKDAGLQIVAATEKSNTLLYEVDLTRPTAIIMGAEDRGISRDILAMCDAEVCIPLAGRIESLNVSAAAAVMLFEATRQRFEKK